MTEEREHPDGYIVITENGPRLRQTLAARIARAWNVVAFELERDQRVTLTLVDGTTTTLRVEKIRDRWYPV